MSRLTYAIVAVAVLGAGCATRKAAATQTTITAFDPAKSDPKAIEIADQVVAALGGAETWSKTQEVVWTQGIIVDGKLVDYATHSWDKWNGRHQYSRLDPNGQEGVTMHELFGDMKYAYVQGKERAEQIREDTIKMAAEATKRLDLDGYRLFLPYKLKDPGVHLKFSEERPDEGVTEANAPMKTDVIQITFDPGVGPAPGDTYYLAIDKATHMPIQIEHVPQGRPDNERTAYKLEDWKDAGGLKFPSKFTNIGYTRPDAAKVNLTIPENWKGKTDFQPTMQVPNPCEMVIVTKIAASPTYTEELYVRDVKL